MKDFSVKEDFRILEQWELEEDYFETNFDEMDGFEEIDEEEINKSYFEEDKKMIEELKNKVNGYILDCARHNEEYWKANFSNAKFASFYTINAKQEIDKLTNDIIDKRIVYKTNLY